MRFAFCLFKYFPFGGLQRDFLRIATECAQRGHQVDVYTQQWEGEKPSTISVHLIPAIGWQNHIRNKNYIIQLKTLLAEQHYDLVVGFNKMPGLDVYFAADTCFQAKVNAQHGPWYKLTPRYRYYVAAEKMVFAQHAKTKLLLISPKQQAEFEHYYQTESDRFYLLPPGISKDRIAPGNAAEIRLTTRAELNLSAQQLLLLCVGSGFKTKGLDRVLIGIAKLPREIKQRVKLIIIGEDRVLPFRRQAKRLGILQQIEFLGGRNDVPRFLLAADVLLHPAYNENTGTVLLEAAVSGLPVLTTDVCGYADYIKTAQVGIVLPSPFQQARFNQALADMLLSSEDRKHWQQNGLAFANQADIYSMAKHAADIIESLAP